MPRVSIAFFGAAAVYVLIGMGLGMWMGATDQYALRPVHAHLNLLGWASLGLMGGFYGLARGQAPPRLAWANFAISNLGNVIMLPSLALVNAGKPLVPLLVTGQVLVVAGVLSFAASVVVVARRTPLA